MYTKLSKSDIYVRIRDNVEAREITISDKYSLICTSKGIIYRKMKSSNWKEIENKRNHQKGYNVIMIDKKQYSRSKLILFAYNKIKLEDKNRNIYHKNLDRLDCSLDNLVFGTNVKEIDKCITNTKLS